MFSSIEARSGRSSRARVGQQKAFQKAVVRLDILFGGGTPGHLAGKLCCVAFCRASPATSPALTAFAHFDDGRTDTIETWPFEDISPGPKKKRVTGAGEVHSVFVFVNIDGTKNIDVEVEASVDGKNYCRTVSGKGTQEIIVHTIRMA